MKRVLLAGEGRNDLGGWFGDPAYRASDDPGPVEMLLRRVAPEGWEIVDAIVWKNIRKARSGGHRSAEHRNVFGVVLHAREHRCDVVVFVRDVDDDDEREDTIEKAIAEASADLEFAHIVGGVAIRKLEAWLLALQGRANTESIRDPKSLLHELGFKTTADYVRLVRDATFAEAYAKG